MMRDGQHDPVAPHCTDVPGAFPGTDESIVIGLSRRWRGRRAAADRFAASASSAITGRELFNEGKSEADVIAPPLSVRSQPAVPPFADGACATRRRSLIVDRPRS